MSNADQWGNCRRITDLEGADHPENRSLGSQGAHSGPDQVPKPGWSHLQGPCRCGFSDFFPHWRDTSGEFPGEPGGEGRRKAPPLPAIFNSARVMSRDGNRMRGSAVPYCPLSHFLRRKDGDGRLLPVGPDSPSRDSALNRKVLRRWRSGAYQPVPWPSRRGADLLVRERSR